MIAEATIAFGLAEIAGIFGGGDENSGVPRPIQALLDAPVGWLPAPPELDDEGGDERWAGTIDVWDRPEGRFYTLTEWGAALLGVHLVEMTGAERKRALALGVPLGDDGPDCRWRPQEDEGPRPRQPRERPHLVRPNLLEEVGVDYRIERDLNRKRVPRARTSTDELLEALRIATRGDRGQRPRRPGLAGGLGRARTPA